MVLDGGGGQGGGVARTALLPGELELRPFRGSVAVAGGLLTAAQLRSSVWRRLFRDVYVAAERPVDHRLRCAGAALLLPPGAAIAGVSAAQLLGAQLAGPDVVSVVCPVAWRGVAGILVHRRALGSAEVQMRAGCPVTTPPATAYEIGRSLPVEEAVVWLDALARVQGLRPGELVRSCAGYRGRPGWRAAARAIGYCDPRSESAPESLVRLWLAQAGLPDPVPQYTVVHQRDFIARLDLAWPSVQFAVEYDGQWHADPGQLGRDRRRLRALHALGWYIYPVTSADLHNRQTLVTTISTLLHRRGLTGTTGSQEHLLRLSLPE